MQKRSGYKAMAGIFQNKKAEYERIIESWMRTILQDGGIERRDDLHIDQIDRTWRKERRLWIPAGLYARELAIAIRDRCELKLSVQLAFSLDLEPGNQPRGIDFHTPEEIEAQFDVTPPSLYLLRPGMDVWTQANPLEAGLGVEDMIVTNLDGGIFGRSAHLADCWFVEYRSRPTDEYSRTIYVPG
jgi:hypothetical protein